MKKICFDLPGDSASPAGTRRGRAKALAEFIIRRLGERCPFKNPPALIKYWALGIAADGEVYMASQSTIGQHYWRTKGKGDPDIDVPVFEHFKFMETGGVRADEAKRMLDEEVEKILAEDAEKAKTAKGAKSTRRRK